MCFELALRASLGERSPRQRGRALADRQIQPVDERRVQCRRVLGAVERCFEPPRRAPQRSSFDLNDAIVSSRLEHLTVENCWTKDPTDDLSVDLACGAAGENRVAVSARPAVPCSRSDDPTRADTRLAAVEESLQIPSAGTRGERGLSVQVDQRTWSASPHGSRATDRGAPRVRRAESDDRTRSARVLPHRSVRARRSGRLRLNDQSCNNASHFRARHATRF